MRHSRSLQVYRLLLRLFPARFRRRRGAEMEALFLDMVRARAARGERLGLRFWSRLAWDTTSHALRERTHPSTTTNLRVPVMSTLLHDLRHARRSVLRQPAYAGMIVLMMTLGIAGNTAVFRLFNGLFLRPLPFEESERLVDLDVRAPAWNLDWVSLAYVDWAAWREHNETFREMAAFTVRGANLAAEGEAPVWADVLTGTWTLPRVLGVEPLVGRLFAEGEDVPGGPKVVLLSEGLWEERFARDPAVLGETLGLDGEPHEILGVLGPEADFLDDADVWTPLQEDPGEGGSFYLSGVGRLRDGVSPEAAEADLARIHRARADERSVNEVTIPVVSSLRDRYLGGYRLGSGVLLGAVGIVLLIACANIAGLMLARSLERRREVGVRLAMGAPRGRIVRQLLLESLLLAGTGAALGGALGVQGSALLVDAVATRLPRWVTFDLDWRFVAFTMAVTGGAAVLFGLAPALRSARSDPSEALRSSSTRSTASSRRRRVLATLVTSEVALAVALLVVAGLGVLDLARLQGMDPGFRTENVLSYRIALPDARYHDPDAWRAFYDEHLERVRALPGVTGAAATTVLPLAGHSGWFFEVEDAPERGEEDANPVVLRRGVTPGYLEVNDVELVAGRRLSSFDGREEGTRVAVVNESFVREFLSHRSDPLGARIRTGGDDAPWTTVVGVNRDVRHYGLGEEMRPGVFEPLTQLARPSLHVTVRAASSPEPLLVAVRASVRELDSQLALFDIATMAERLEESLGTRRASSWLLAAFSAVALLLAVAGIYGVVSYTVGQRVHEIGIRMALGARGRQVQARVLRQGMVMVGLGAVLGLVAARLAAPLASGALASGMSATEPRVYAGVAALLVAVAALANLVPARRAARLDPMRVLRGE